MTSSHRPRRSFRSSLAFELPQEILREHFYGEGKYTARLAETADDVAANRRFATTRFLELGKIKPELIDPNTGLLYSDPYHEAGMVQYVTTYRGEEIVSVGKLFWKPGVTMDELRTPFDQVDDRFAHQMDALGPGAVAELGSLAKRRGMGQVATLSTLREIYRIAEEQGVHYMVAGLEPKAWPRYRDLFKSGIEPMRADGKPVFYPGIEGGQVGIRMDVTNAYNLYHDDAMKGTLRNKIERHLVLEYYAHRVASFHSKLGRVGLRGQAQALTLGDK